MMSPLPRLRLTLLLAAWVFAGCGRPFAIQTPPGLVEPRRRPDFAYRAMTPDEVVLGVRVVDAGNADVAFWTEAVWLHMKDLTGYALLTSADVSSADGTRGKELRFSHVNHGRDFEYTVRVFVPESTTCSSSEDRRHQGGHEPVSRGARRRDGVPPLQLTRGFDEAHDDGRAAHAGAHRRARRGPLQETSRSSRGARTRACTAPPGARSWAGRASWRARWWPRGSSRASAWPR